MDRMPREVLCSIIRHVFAFEPGERAILPLLYVCRQWTPLVETLLHEKITITTARGLKSFRSRLLSSLYDGTKHVGIRVESLETTFKIHEEDDADLLRDSVTCILANTTSLRQFSAWYHQAGYADLTCLLRSCAATLSTLRLVISGRLCGAFQIINQLYNLNALNLAFDDPVEPDLWAHPQDHCLHLPAVRHLNWTWAHHDNVEMVQFLTNCTFRECLVAHLNLPEMSPATAPSLIPFFHNNALKELWCNIPPDTQSILAPVIMRIHDVHLTAGPPCVELLQHQCLPAIFDIGFGDDTDALLSFLNVMLTMQVEFHESPKIKIMCNFSWLGGKSDEDQAEFVGRLLPVAAALLRRDIKVVDDLNEDITCLTRDISLPS